MDVVIEQVSVQGKKIVIKENGVVVGRCYVYLLSNDLHEQPFGLLEDVFVNESVRGKGLGRTLLTKAIEVAKEAGCYKLLCQSRYGKDDLHAWYERCGFTDYGKNFRMDFI